VAAGKPNAAFYFAGHNYRTAGDMVVGRQSASGGFLKGFIRHGGTDTLYCYSNEATGHHEFAEFAKEAGATQPLRGFLPPSMDRIAEVGTLFRPGPGLGPLAWNRRHFDVRGFSLVGITHTVSDAAALDAIGDILVAPVESWDALVCTSKSVQTVVRGVLDEWAGYLEARFGQTPLLPRLPIIPLGVDAEALAARGSNAAARADLRRRMNIADGDVAILYAGRLDHVEKANPVPMLLAAETAARTTKKKLHLLQAGQASTPEMAAAFKQAATALAPSINHHFIDGARTDLYDSAWAAADIFISLSDNIQESFGLTPIEAMAAGLPCVVSDWNGYRESVIDGDQGFTVPTAMPPAGAGQELGYIYGSGFASYSVFTGAASQSTAVDPAAVAAALGRLIEDGVLRQRMGAAGGKRAAKVYDWRHVVAGHQALWTELAELRADAPECAPRPKGTQAHPLRPDPFAAFRRHPTLAIGGGTMLSAAGAIDSEGLKVLIRSELATPLATLLLDVTDTAALLTRLAKDGPLTAEALGRDVPDDKRVPFHLTLGWLAKMGFVQVAAGADEDADGEATLPFGASTSWKRLSGD
jgi:starch synthase